MSAIRTLTPDQEEAVRDAVVIGGAHPQSLAEQYKVSKRTIYRTLRRRRRGAQPVRVGPYVALFELAPNGPKQLTDWFASEDGAS